MDGARLIGDASRMRIRGWLLALALALPGAARAEEPRTLVEQRESVYNNIFVYRQGPYLSMTFGRNRALYTESIYNTADERELPVAYTRFMTAGLAYAKKLDRILEIGFGGGRTAWYLHRFLPQAQITSVELDPAVVELARKYFGVREEANFKVVSEDGRIFLFGASERYDLVLIDAYRGPFVPFHLTTREFYELVKNHLAEGGAIAENIEPSTLLFDSVAKTVNAVFPHLDLYYAEGNIVTIAYPGDRRAPDELERVASERQAALGLRYDLRHMLKERMLYGPRVVADGPQPVVLTDDFAPVETLRAIEVHNRQWPK
jgi:spermidine synthase